MMMRPGVLLRWLRVLPPHTLLCKSTTGTDPETTIGNRGKVGPLMTRVETKMYEMCLRFDIGQEVHTSVRSMRYHTETQLSA